jgi:hypothetical protein
MNVVPAVWLGLFGLFTLKSRIDDQVDRPTLERVVRVHQSPRAAELAERRVQGRTRLGEGRQMREEPTEVLRRPGLAKRRLDARAGGFRSDSGGGRDPDTCPLEEAPSVHRPSVHPGDKRALSAPLCLDAELRAVEPVERGADVDVLADEDRRVALRVARSLAVAEREHQVHEVRGLVALERRS